MKRAEGSLLYLDIIMPMLCDTLSSSKPSKASELRAIIAQLPQGVDGMYQYLVREASDPVQHPETGPLVPKVLSRMVNLYDPPSLAELSMLAGISEQETVAVLDTLSSLLILRGGGQIVQVKHRSFTEFLQDPRQAKVLSVESPNVAHMEIAKILLRELKASLARPSGRMTALGARAVKSAMQHARAAASEALVGEVMGSLRNAKSALGSSLSGLRKKIGDSVQRRAKRKLF